MLQRSTGGPGRRTNGQRTSRAASKRTEHLTRVVCIYVPPDSRATTIANRFLKYRSSDSPLRAMSERDSSDAVSYRGRDYRSRKSFTCHYRVLRIFLKAFRRLIFSSDQITRPPCIAQYLIHGNSVALIVGPVSGVVKHSLIPVSNHGAFTPLSDFKSTGAKTL